MVENVEELRVEGGGIKAAFRGRETLCVILTLLFAIAVAYLILQHDQKGDQRARAQLVATEKLAAAVERQEETQRVLIFVMSLTPTEREKLNLAKPKLLYEMQR